MTVHRARVHRPAGLWPKEATVAAVTLEFEWRQRRRIRLRTDDGEEILLDLAQTIAMADEDGLQLDDGRWLQVRAAPEPIVEVRHADPVQLMRLAWYLGNRHLATEMRQGALRIRPDHVIEYLLARLGASLVKMHVGFQPEPGACTGGVHDHD
jgi:urease accessory protein